MIDFIQVLDTPLEQMSLEEMKAERSAHAWVRYKLNAMVSHLTMRLHWLKENKPEIYRRARWYLNIKDYLYGCLTGRMGYTDYSDASLTIALDINRRQWSEELLRELDSKQS